MDSFLSRLSNYSEIFITILSFLSLNEKVLVAFRVNKKWYHLLRNNKRAWKGDTLIYTITDTGPVPQDSRIWLDQYIEKVRLRPIKNNFVSPFVRNHSTAKFKKITIEPSQFGPDLFTEKEFFPEVESLKIISQNHYSAWIDLYHFETLFKENLKELKLSGTYLFLSHLEYITTLTNLEKLDLDFYTSPLGSHSVFESMEKNYKTITDYLTPVDWSGTYPYDFFPGYKLTSLTELSLSYRSQRLLPSFENKSSSLPAIQLKKVYVDSLTPALYSFLIHSSIFKSLVELSISFMTHYPALPWTTWKNLEKLSIFYCFHSCGFVQLKGIEQLTSLKELFLCNFYYQTEEDLVIISKCSSLKSLNIMGTDSKSLGLSGKMYLFSPLCKHLKEFILEDLYLNKEDEKVLQEFTSVKLTNVDFLEKEEKKEEK